MLRDEARTIRREQTQGTAAMIVGIALVGWMFQDEAFSPLGLLILLGVFVLCGIHQQLCGIQLDTIYREIREQSPHLWRDL